MRAVHSSLHWMLDIDQPIDRYLKLSLLKQIEIGLGIAIWAGLIFIVVHFGGIAPV